MRICIVSYTADVLLGGGSGGAEKQLTLMARHLAEHGHEVAMVVPGYVGAPDLIDGVRLLPGWSSRGGVRWLRAFTHRLPQFRHLLTRLDADCYYTMGVSLYAPSMVRVARRHGSVSMVALASDRDLFHESGKHTLVVGLGPLDRIAGWFAHVYFERTALRSASLVATQNDEQSEACARLGLRHALIPNLVEDPPPSLHGVEEDIDAIWVGNVVGRSRRSKGVEELYLLAKALPELRFAVVGALTGPDAVVHAEALRKLPNVLMPGLLPYSEALCWVARAKLTLNTSPSEGFSNVTLEGWSLGKPAVTLWVDPSRLLDEGGLGACAGGDLAAMRKAVTELVRDNGLRMEMGERCKAYVRAQHGPDGVCSVFEDLVSRHAVCSCGATEYRRS